MDAGGAGGLAGDRLIIREVEDGVLRYGLQAEPGRRGDRVSMLWGRSYWWPGTTTQWGPFDLQEYPLLEMRWRGTPPTVWFSVTLSDGTVQTDYTSPSRWPTEETTDEQGREWRVSSFRVAAEHGVHTNEVRRGEENSQRGRREGSPDRRIEN